MFPHAYTYNPGVVLDPVTMTPMVTNGGSVTVNPLGVPMRPEQKIWQKMMVKNIPEQCPNEVLLRLLNEFGAVKNFKRAVDQRGRLMTFGHFDLETGEEILRIRRLFMNIKMLDKMLEIKISADTDNFIKEWMTIQKDEWRKKLLSHGYNEAKEFESIEAYQMRDDKKYKQRIEDTLKQVNVQVKRLANEKARQDERKQHPKEKERDRAKRKALEDLERNFHEKQEYWLKREREKEREYRKEKEKEKEKEKMKVRRLEKELALDEEELEKRAFKCVQPDRRRQIQKEEAEDIEILMQEHPPLPDEKLEETNRRVKAIMEEEFKVGNEKVQQMLVEAPKRLTDGPQPQKELKRNEIFSGWDKVNEEQKAKPKIELSLPELIEEEVNQEEEQRRAAKIMELQKLVPQNKQDLWEFPIDWEKLAKSVVLERNIRPWLQKRSEEYMGGIQQKFIALVEKRLLSRSHPDKIIKILEQLLDDDAEQFVLRLWKVLVLQFLKLQNGLE